MSDGSTAILKWTRSRALVKHGTVVAQNLSIAGDWNGKLDVSGKRANLSCISRNERPRMNALE